MPAIDTPTRAALLRGACLCDAARYRVPDAFRYALICHCSQCRRATGAASKPFAGIEREHLVIDGDEAALLRWGDGSDHDMHCRSCGSLLYSVVRDGRWVHVTLGTLVDEPSIRPRAHIFVGSKASWDTICGELPRFDAHAQ